MCEQIRFPDFEIGTVRQFQDHFKVDAKDYGFDGNEEFLDHCLCQIDLKKFFIDHPEHGFYYDCGDWFKK